LDAVFALMVKVPRARAREESVRMCILAGRLVVLVVGRKCEEIYILVK
jgi:hypothetical protein